MKKLIFTLVMLLSLPALATAEPTYLTCRLNENSESPSFALKVDESSGKITQTYDDRSAFNTDGFFSPTTVSYKKIDYLLHGEVSSSMVFEVNRETLVIKKTHTLGLTKPDPSNPPKTIVVSGQCEVIKIKDRKF